MAGVAFIGKAEALRGLKQVLGKDASVVDQLPANPLPRLARGDAVGGGRDAGGRSRARRASRRRCRRADEVAGSVDWVEQLSHWQRLLTTIGLGVGAVLGIAAILTVTTATTLVLHARRHETEIMRLVGASEVTIRLPLLLQGMMQGLAGAVLALATLVLTYSLVAPRLEPLVNLTLGLSQLVFFTPLGVMALLGAGTLLGGLGGWLARARSRAVSRRAALAALLAVLAVVPAAAQTSATIPCRPSSGSSSRRRSSSRRSASARRRRARETSLLAELEEVERRLAAKKATSRAWTRGSRRRRADVQVFRGEISKLESQRAGQTNALAGRLRVMYRVHAQGGAPSGDSQRRRSRDARRRGPSSREPGGPGRPLDSRVSCYI